MKKLIILFFCLLTVVVFIQQERYWKANKGEYSYKQNFRGAIDWLNENTSKDDVVLTESVCFPDSPSFIRFLQLYTKNYYYVGYDAHCFISEDEFQYRYLAAMYFFQYPQEQVDAIIDYADGILFVGMSAGEEAKRFGKVIPKSYFDKIKKKFSRFSGDPIILLKKYKADYLLLWENDRTFNLIEDMYSLEKVFDDGFARIYKL